jgi:hypothetical protein
MLWPVTFTPVGAPAPLPEQQGRSACPGAQQRCHSNRETNACPCVLHPTRAEALQAVDETTEQGGPAAARLYSNRALCCMQRTPPDPGAALQDATCAGECDPGYCKAWYRRACALRALGDAPAALRDARHALDLQRRQLGVAAETEALVAVLSVDAAASAQRQAPGPAQGQEQPGGGCRAGEVTPAAELLTVHEGAAAGRQLAAAVDLPAGALVLREAPFALALTKRGRRTVSARCMQAAPCRAAGHRCTRHGSAGRWGSCSAGAKPSRMRAQACAHCCRTMPARAVAWYCRACPMLRYCSTACRAGDTWHLPGGAECGLPWTAVLPPQAVLALRVARKLAQQVRWPWCSLAGRTRGSGGSCMVRS